MEKSIEDQVRMLADPSQTPEEVAADIEAVKAEFAPQEKPTAPVEEEKQEDTPAESTDEGAEPEPLELEKALASLRRAGFTQKQLDRLAKRDVLETGLKLSKQQADFDALKRDHADFKAKAEKPATEAKTPAPSAADLSKKLSDLVGDDVAPALADLVKAYVDPIIARLEAAESRDATRIIESARTALRDSFPQVAEEATWSEVLDAARGLAATAKYRDTSEGECLSAACRALGLKPRQSMDEVERKTASRLNGTPKSSGRVVESASKTREELEFEAFLAWEDGDRAQQKRLLALANKAK